MSDVTFIRYSKLLNIVNLDTQKVVFTSLYIDSVKNWFKNFRPPEGHYVLKVVETYVEQGDLDQSLRNNESVVQS